MNIEQHVFGRLPGGEEVPLVTVETVSGFSVSLTSYGATIVSVRVPDGNGEPGDVTLGFDTLDGYLADHPYFGATIGRYANRISGASFELDGKRYDLAANAGEHHLHGGVEGFDAKVWELDIAADEGMAVVRFHRISPGGEEGYPGNLDVEVTYTVTEDQTINTTYKPTPINLTNHAYWNLTRPGTEVFDQELRLFADRYLAIDDKLIPDGTIVEVDSTPFDFREKKPIGRDFEAAGYYDHNYILDPDIGGMKSVAIAESPATGRRMRVETTQPAVQLYTTNSMNPITGHGGIEYPRYGAFCLETGGYNNAINIPSFPSSILRPGERYLHETRHSFEVF